MQPSVFFFPSSLNASPSKITESKATRMLESKHPDSFQQTVSLAFGATIILRQWTLSSPPTIAQTSRSTATSSLSPTPSLSLNHSLPLSQWYSNETNPWTLDYPPFFADFERVLSIFTNLINTQIVHLQEGLNYSFDTVVLFQRITMILFDLCLLYGVYRLTKDLDWIQGGEFRSGY
jgi:hypothetical protein